MTFEMTDWQWELQALYISIMPLKNKRISRRKLSEMVVVLNILFMYNQLWCTGTIYQERKNPFAMYRYSFYWYTLNCDLLLTRHHSMLSVFLFSLMLVFSCKSYITSCIDHLMWIWFRRDFFAEGLPKFHFIMTLNYF